LKPQRGCLNNLNSSIGQALLASQAGCDTFVIGLRNVVGGKALIRSMFGSLLTAVLLLALRPGASAELVFEPLPPSPELSDRRQSAYAGSSSENRT
jgi:hypothetical protein